MGARQSLAVIGSGISGLGAAWLLSKAHDVTLFEAEHRPGGHSNTVEAPGPAGAVPVDTGFIVYNTASYPNLIALFDHLGVSTAPTDMSFAVSLDNGGYEYAGSSVATLFGQPANALRPSHWRMILDILRFFREAPSLIEHANDESMTLAQYLRMMRYSDAFVARHILPMAAAIWSTPSRQVLDFPVASFVRFFANHGLLQVRDRPQWRTVEGGSREYVKRILAATNGTVRLREPALRITRTPVGTSITTAQGTRKFDGCVIATHADDALALLADPDDAERRLLGAFHYIDNRAVLHRDASLMPRRRGLWSSWNYLGRSAGCDPDLSLTYWMNKLQPLGAASPDYFVTLNPGREIATSHQVAEFGYRHPLFDSAAMVAQRRLWELQGVRRTWFCGSYFGYGFHEDGLQAGLAVAEAIGGVRRPWSVARESGRIHLPQAAPVAARPVLEAAE